MSLQGKAAVVSGESRGIGRAIAQAMLDAGAKVMITGRTKDSIDTALAELGEGSFGHLSDISIEADVAGLCAYAVGTLGAVDILDNNAGINPYHKRAEHTKLDEWRQIIDIN